ncbi:type II secretion system F family protein [Rhodovulum sulfidophilum]|uniref:type II secretion system F family protein n=1 Tax=Rhodovulum sulfidophilum TaxID=35806 RepID=UPI00138940BA|nr:type II secretion system F family protein [Rhodovulum sulfidophilum]NDK33625.1 type II secretion system F family protein [Rhodovulum sulfidophilum]
MAFVDLVNGWLTDRLGPLGPLIAMGLLGLGLVALSLPVFLRRRSDPLDKLRRQVRAAETAGARDPQAALRHASGPDRLDRFSTLLEPRDEKALSAARLRLIRAGYRSKSAVRLFHFAQFALGLLFLSAGLVHAFVLNAGGNIGTSGVILSVLLPGAAGYYLPKYWVERRLQSRQEDLTNGFPDSLDMMLVCVEAGQSLDQSILRVARELRPGFPALAAEYEIVSNELKAGKDRVQVLRDMSERCGITDISFFITVLIQSATFGTSIAGALRVFSAEMRDKRVMRAEEKANKLPTKLTLGTMMFTVPPLLIILIGPSIYEIYDSLQNADF